MLSLPAFLRPFGTSGSTGTEISGSDLTTVFSSVFSLKVKRIGWRNVF